MQWAVLQVPPRPMAMPAPADKMASRPAATPRSDTMPPQGPSPPLFFDTISAYQRTEALRAAIELDLFSLVAGGRQTATELADACQAAPRGIRILADTLTI